MRFNKTITFQASDRIQLDAGSLELSTQVGSSTQLVASTSNSATAQSSGRSAKKDEIKVHWRSQPPLKSAEDGESPSGQAGFFHRVKNDFTTDDDEDDDDDDEDEDNSGGRMQHRASFCNEPHWDQNEKEEIRKVRFFICSFALLGLAFALMSRLILNVSIVEMVESQPMVVAHPDDDEEHMANLTIPLSVGLDHNLAIGSTGVRPTDNNQTQLPSDLQNYTQHHYNPQNQQVLNSDLRNETLPPTHMKLTNNNTNSNETFAAALYPVLTTETNLTDETQLIDNPLTEMNEEHQEPNDGMHFNWSKRQVNMVLGSFFIGYAPAIFFSGSVAERYGAKYPLFFSVLGTSLINILTPHIARISVNLLIASRILLGIIQGGLLPCLYELFNQWLTMTESSIFAPMIKVSIPMGSLIGTLMPGILAAFGLQWPFLFYIGGSLCLVWSILWFYVGTSTPRTNRFVEPNELRRILRKKNFGTLELSVVTEKPSDHQSNRKACERTDDGSAKKSGKQSTPWLKIMTNPSVLALTLVKFTYNCGMDFIYLMLALYLRDMHGASIETISAIASGGYCMQMLLITLIGWVAKTVVGRRALGLSITQWRKLFQGGSNVTMALVYVALAFSEPDLELTAYLLLLVCLFWMLGAGGESMVPYDLSSRYPASIVGLAHSISVLSGITMPALFSTVVGESTEDPDCWRNLFLIIAAGLTLGGVVFALVLKAKPFLPGEKVPKAERARQQAERQLNGLSGKN